MIEDYLAQAGLNKGSIISDDPDQITKTLNAMDPATRVRSCWEI